MLTFQTVRGPLSAIRCILIKPAALAVLLAGFAAAASTGACAHDPVNNVVAHVQAMLQFVYDSVGASDVQKTRFAALAQQAGTDLAPVQEQMRKSHSQMFSLLTADTIDRRAIETARAEQMSAAEQESRRATQFVADIAETLTPQQRKALAEHMSQHGH